MKKMFLNLFLMLSISGCALNTSTTLKGKEYTLQDTNYTLIFDKEENKFYGKAVNSYFGIYTLDKNNIKLELQGSTMMMAHPAEMEKETKYFNNLNQITTYSINDNNLILQGNNVELKYTPTHNLK